MKTTKDCRHLLRGKCMKRDLSCVFHNLQNGDATGCSMFARHKIEDTRNIEPMTELNPEPKVIREKHLLLSSETILPDNYPVHYGYVYIVDMKFAKCPLIGNDNFEIGDTFNKTVLDLKRFLNAKEVRRCDLFGHSYARVGDELTVSLE